MTETTPSTAGPTAARPARPAGKRGHAALGGRILVAGLAVGGGLGLVGAMGAAARTSPPMAAAEPARRVIVVDRTITTDAVGSTLTTASDPAVTLASGEPAPLPLPLPPGRQSAPSVSQSQGS